MTPEERLASLTAWAEKQKYVQPGEGGTFAVGEFNYPTKPPRRSELDANLAVFWLDRPLGYSNHLRHAILLRSSQICARVHCASCASCV